MDINASTACCKSKRLVLAKIMSASQNVLFSLGCSKASELVNQSLQAPNYEKGYYGYSLPLKKMACQQLPFKHCCSATGVA
jgi:hypothetical protein